MLYRDDVFAPLDRDLHMERVAGGNETEVYATDDRRYVVKVKGELGGELPSAVRAAREMRAAAAEFAECLGVRHTIPSYYVIARGSDRRVHPLVVQPYVRDARPLAALDYRTLDGEQRAFLAAALHEIIRRATAYYRATGRMPDLYGRSSSSSDERRRENTILKLPKRLWSFLVRRTILRSHNLLLCETPEPRVLLVDYDTVRRSRLYRTVYFSTRAVLFARDSLWTAWMRRGGPVPRT